MIHYKSIDQAMAKQKGLNISDEETAFRAFDEVIKSQESDSYVLLKTCNRTEIYYGEGDIADGVANHLFRVVSGLEAALVGERAVQGQVKDAYYSAIAERKLSAEMNKLFLMALETGKQVRNETEISKGAVSHSLAAIEIIEKLGVDLHKAHITLVGVNKLTEDILKFLQNKGAEMIVLANRSEEKAHALADPLHIGVCGLQHKRDFLKDTDILISATSAPGTVINYDDIAPGKSLLAIDLAFPRDIDPKIAEHDGVRLYNIRDVERLVQNNIDVRQGEVSKAEAIIARKEDELIEALARRKKYLQVG